MAASPKEKDLSVVEVSRGQASATNGAEPSHEVLLQRARVIAAAARDRAAETEAGRVVPAATIEELKQADLLRLMTPRRWGGLGRSFAELCDIVYELAQGCGSTGWVYAVLGGHATTLADYPEDVQQTVWGGDPNTVASSAFMPSGKAEPTPGGYRVSGRFPFSSGSDHAQWAIVGCIKHDAGAPPAPGLFLIPRSDLSTIDDWHTMGLCGTGSRSLVAEDLFVPAERVLPMIFFTKGVAPFGLQAVVVGAAVGLVNNVIAQTAAKPGRFGGPPASASELLQVELGRAWGEVTSAWELLSTFVRRVEAVAPGGHAAPDDIAAKSRAVGATISELAISGLERAYSLSGGHGVYTGDVSRAYRDARSGYQHGVISPIGAAREAGQFRLTVS